LVLSIKLIYWGRKMKTSVEIKSGKAVETFLNLDGKVTHVVKTERSEQNIGCVAGARLLLIKNEAGDRISATAWKLDRCKERAVLLGVELSTYKPYVAVLLEREGIRKASNEAEVAVNKLSTVEQINGFVW